MSPREAILKALEASGDPSAIAAEAARLVEGAERPAIGQPLDLRFLPALEAPSVAATSQRIVGIGALPEAVRGYVKAHALPPEITLASRELAGADWRGLSLLPRPPIDGGIVVALARAGVAEAGSLIVETGAGAPMLHHFLALHHIVALHTRDIVAHLEDIPRDPHPPRGHFWITGVSGTTDIEGQYVRGAHGPRHLHVVLIDG